MKESVLSLRDIEALKTLADFYYRVNLFESSMRTLKVMLTFNPGDVWARGMLARCHDRMRSYSEVIALTDDMSFFKSDESIMRAMMLLRARALLKEGRGEESRVLILELTADGKGLM
ncbi:MAG: hypothetical protein II922_12725 [Succinimonas sp.]|jgi:hypothetical protein|nr:hypothetical protein [Succinimonas sp.]MEE3422408.1 hypothetical protein [Succinimonas sp.]